MVDDQGWQRPERYGSPEEEVRAVQAGVGLCDISPLGKLDLKGKESASVLQQLFSLGTIPRVGQVTHISLKNIANAPSEGLCCRLGSDHLLVVIECSTAGAVEQSLTQHLATADQCAHLTNLTSALAAVQLVGPYSRDVLRKLTALDLSPNQPADLTCAQGGVAKVHALVVRADLGSQLAYEIYCGREFGVYLWDALRDAGQEFGAVPFGLAAQRLLRVEG